MTTIKIERDIAPCERDFRVMIDGEHRANFRSRKRYRRVGYDFQAADGGHVHLKKNRYYMEPNKAEFVDAVRAALGENAIPTRAEIDRVIMIEQAQRENHERDEAIARRNAEIGREVEIAAFTRYVEEHENDPAMAEHVARARDKLRWITRKW